MDEKNTYTIKTAHLVKFIICSLVGVFLFMVLIPDGAGAANIPLGFVISALGLAINSVEVGGFGLLFFIALLLINISFFGTVVAYTLKPSFIMDNPKLRDAFLSHPVYFVSKLIAVVIVWMVFLGLGPGMIVDQWLGGWMMMDLIAGGSSGANLMSIFIVLGITIPILTDFGIMEFLGTLIRKVVRFLFTLPGRSSVDLLGSWFSSSAASVIITRNQHEKGYYTGREAATICVNFTLVSLPFTFTVASTVGLQANFIMFYLIICISSIILAIIMPRLWPLRGLKDEYLPEVGKQIEEDVPSGKGTLSWAATLASKRASESGVGSTIKSGLSNWLNIFMDLIPVILAWGTIALILAEETPIFDWLSTPFRLMLELLRVEDAATYAAATIVGFVDMFIPALLLSGRDAYGYFAAPLETRFILAALSIVQIIYLAETGILILKSKMPLNIGHLAILFVMRTVLALPLIVLLTRLMARL